MQTQIMKDGQKNFSVFIKGITKGDFSPTPILDISKISAPATGWKGLRLDAAVWAIQEKMGMNLWWNNPESETDLVFPLESRNSMRLDEGIPSPRIADGWRGILYLSSFRTLEVPGPKTFFILLDFDKQ